MMNAFMEPHSAQTHHAHAHHLASYGLKMSPTHSALQDNVSGGMLASGGMNVNSDHSAVGMTNTAYQSNSLNGYGPSAAASAPYSSYSRDYLLKRDQDYFSMTGQGAPTAATADPMLFSGIHHTHPAHAMHDNQFASYHQMHRMNIGAPSSTAPTSSPVSGQIPTATPHSQSTQSASSISSVCAQQPPPPPQIGKKWKY